MNEMQKRYLTAQRGELIVESREHVFHQPPPLFGERKRCPTCHSSMLIDIPMASIGEFRYRCHECDIEWSDVYTLQRTARIHHPCMLAPEDEEEDVPDPEDRVIASVPVDDPKPVDGPVMFEELMTALDQVAKIERGTSSLRTLAAALRMNRKRKTV